MNPYQPPSSSADAAPAPRTTIQPFTPIGKLFGQALSLYLGSFATIAGVTLVVFAPVEIVKNYLVHAARQDNDLVTSTRIDGLVEVVFGALVTAALLAALAHKIETGRDLGVKGALAAGAKRWGGVLGARLRSGILIGVGLLLFVVPGILWMVRYALTDEVATLEHDRGSKRVMNRSAALVAGHGWRVFGVGLLGMLAVLASAMTVGIVAGFVEAWTGQNAWIISAAVDCVCDVVYRFLTVLLLLIYLGITAEKEPA